MASFVESTIKDIDDRLKALKQEVEQLEAARAALGGAARRGPGRPRGSRNRRTRSTTASKATRPRRTTARRGRGRRGGTRAGQALQLVTSKPGITIPEIAKSMGIEPNYLYRVLPRMAQEGQVKRTGQGWHPA